ncbi:MAG: NTP transferase domain-containing protein [Microthrixaceae bacterium]
MQPTSPKLSHLIVVAGGSGERLGGVDKAWCEVGGRRLIDHALDVPATGRRIVVRPAGRDPIASTSSCSVEQVAEQPVGGGPAAGMAAGVMALMGGSGDGAGSAGSRQLSSAEDGPGEDELVAVLACDAMAPVAPVMSLLADALRRHADAGVAVAAPGGSPQWLTAVWRFGALRSAVRQFGDPRHAPVRLLVGLGRPREVPTARIASLDGPLDLLEAVASGDSAVGLAGDEPQRSRVVAALTSDTGWRATDAVDPAGDRATVLARPTAEARAAADRWVLLAPAHTAVPPWAAAKLVALSSADGPGEQLSG